MASTLHRPFHHHPRVTLTEPFMTWMMFFGDYIPPTPLDDEDSIGQFLKPFFNSSELELHWAESESIGRSRTSHNYSSLGRLDDVLELECQPSEPTTLPSPDNLTVWVDDLIGSSSFFAPDDAFDGQIPEDECVLLYMLHCKLIMNISL
jgi:hypothetical protein